MVWIPLTYIKRKGILRMLHQQKHCQLGLMGTETSSNAAAAAKLLQSCPTLCSPIDGSPLGSSVPVILQARILEGVAISFSNAYMHAKSL